MLQWIIFEAQPADAWYWNITRSHKFKDIHYWQLNFGSDYKDVKSLSFPKAVDSSSALQPSPSLELPTQLANQPQGAQTQSHAMSPNKE
jgi:hypothetical protein